MIYHTMKRLKHIPAAIRRKPWRRRPRRNPDIYNVITTPAEPRILYAGHSGMRQRAYDGGPLGADGVAGEARSPSRLFYCLQKSTNLRIRPNPSDFSDGSRTARDICLQKSTKIYMRTCAREFRRGRPSARYKAARNGPAPEKERRFGAFSLPRFRPFPSPVLRSVRPRSDRHPCHAADSCPLPACLLPNQDSVGPAIDPASRRSDFRGADPGTPDPRLSARAY